MKHTPSKVIVDTHVLTDGTMNLVSYRPFRGSPLAICEDVAHRALIGATSHLATNLREAIGSNDVSYSHKPLARYQTPIMRTVWHHGEQFMSYCIGPVSDIIPLCDLTENEREALETLSNRLAGEGKIAFGLASGAARTLITRSADYTATLAFVGIAAFEPVLFPHVLGNIEKLQEKGTAIIYVSRDSAALVHAIAHAAGIKATTVYVAKPHMHTADMQLVADVPPKDYQTLVGRYSPEAYIVQHDISELA